MGQLPVCAGAESRSPGPASCTSSWSSGGPASSLGKAGDGGSAFLLRFVWGLHPTLGARAGSSHKAAALFLPSCAHFLTFQEAL